MSVHQACRVSLYVILLFTGTPEIRSELLTFQNLKTQIISPYHYQRLGEFRGHVIFFLKKQSEIGLVWRGMVTSQRNYLIE